MKAEDNYRVQTDNSSYMQYIWMLSQNVIIPDIHITTIGVTQLTGIKSVAHHSQLTSAHTIWQR